jgi:carbonic anhydrase
MTARDAVAREGMTFRRTVGDRSYRFATAAQSAERRTCSATPTRAILRQLAESDLISLCRATMRAGPGEAQEVWEAVKQMSTSSSIESARVPGNSPGSKALVRKRSSHGSVASAVALSVGLVGCSIGGLALGEATSAQGTKQAQWTYAGKQGPERWAELDPRWSACGAGKSQSPVDIAPARLLKADWVSEMRFAYKGSKKLEIVNNGHTIQVNPERGNWLGFDKVWYELKHLRFHSPSEHTLTGVNTAMEMHLVHAADANRFAVISVMLQLGADNPFIDRFWGALPAEANGKAQWSGELNILDALPNDRSFYTYQGSLTTPPCSETVSWLIMTTPLTVSKAQVEKYSKVFGGPTNRPVQALNGRVIVEQVPAEGGAQSATDAYGAAPAGALGAAPKATGAADSLGAAPAGSGAAPAAPAAPAKH